VGGGQGLGHVGVGDQLGHDRLHGLPDGVPDGVLDGVGDRLVQRVGSGVGCSDRVVRGG
jgi:hypothetical protein